MNRKSRISFGPGAASLTLIVVILSLSMLGILALLNARSDAKLSRRSIEVIEAEYALADAAERSLARLDAAAARVSGRADSDDAYLDLLAAVLPEGMELEMEDRQITWTETDGYRTLACAVEASDWGTEPRLTWTQHRMTAITEDVWD